MGLFKRKQEARASDNDVMTVESAFPTDASLRAILGGNTITAKDAMQIPAFASCVNFIKDTISMLPIKLYKQDLETDGKKIIQEIEGDARCKLLNAESGDTLTSTQMKAAWVKDYLLYGSGYVYINKKFNDVESLHYITHEDFSINKSVNPIFKTFEIYVQGERYFSHNFLKILRSTKDGCSGMGIPYENSDILKVAFEELKFEGKLVKKGGNKRGFLKSQRRLTQEAMDKLKAAWEILYSNNEEERIPILNDGLEFQECSSSSVELQLNQNKLTNKKEICSIFKICPSVLDETASDEEYNLTIKMAILPILNEITSELNKNLLLEKEKASYFFAFDTSEVMRGDLEKRYSAYKSAVSAGWITKNEIRAKENMVAIPGLDIVGMSLGDVLFDVETQTFFTPNTGIVTDQKGSVADETSKLAENKEKGVEKDANRTEE